MQPTQLSSWATIIGNHPILFGVVRHAKTSVGHTLRQNPQALHMSSPTTTSHLPAGPRGAFFSSLNSAIPVSLHHHLQYDLLGTDDVSTRQLLGALAVAGGDGRVDRAVFTVGIGQSMGRPEQHGVEALDAEPDDRRQGDQARVAARLENFLVEGDVGAEPLVGVI